MDTQHIDRELTKDRIAFRGTVGAIRWLQSAYSLDEETATKYAAEVSREMDKETWR